MKLMGVDVGYSAKGATTGIACLDGDQLHLARAGTTWEERKRRLPCGFRPSVIALDGPLLPQGADERTRRSCEYTFIRAPFHHRCRPGLSHSGSGLDLRRAASNARVQFGRTLACSPSDTDNVVSRSGPVVEAFPNAFLGVLTSESDFLSAPKFRRGQRFDWLYERIVTAGRLECSLAPLLELPANAWRRLREETDHELRSALICLLTAALAARKIATVVGRDSEGWFWLPPRVLWEPWAAEGLDGAIHKMALKGRFVDLSDERCI